MHANAKLGVETGAMTPWLVHGLRAAGLDVAVLDARRQAALTNVNKVREAFAAIGAAAASPPAILAAQPVALTAVRCGSARGAR